MKLIETAVDAITGRGQRAEPVGTIKVVDPSALNWSYITDNTVDELARVGPPSTQFNDHSGTTIEVAGDHTVRFRFPRPDGLLAIELRAMHLMTTRFWEDVGFGTTRFGTGEGHW